MEPRRDAVSLSWLVLAVLCVVSCARSTAPDARGQGPSAAERELALHAQTWRSQQLSDYVFVVDHESMVIDFAKTRLRVVVAGGRVRSASSLLYGSSPDLAFVPTIDALLDRAERLARGVPHRFEASYDSQYGVPLHVWSDPSEHIADDESGFTISCFSLDADGCSAIPMTAEQCASAGGQTVDIATALWCGQRSSGSIGLVAGAVACCRDWGPDSTSGISAEQCEAAGGHIADCARDEVTIGTVPEAQRSCCRQFMR